jgi:ferredoxin-NADP reductase
MGVNLANVSGSVHEATVSAIEPLAAGVLAYSLALDDADARLAWRAGQFISLTCGKRDDGEPILRSYSIASRPGGRWITLVVKLIDGGAASAWFARLTVGERVRFTGPMGFFVLELSHPGDLVFAATGTGIAPVVPMIAEALARGEAGRVHLLWGVRAEEDLFWQRELAALEHPRLSKAIHMSRPSSAWSGARGRITQPALALLPSLAEPTFYLCGNGAMIKELKAELQARGVDRKRRIRTEAFFE